jgi:multidrug efflux pump subunit AcrB
MSDLSIRNPVFAVMLSAAMVIFGWLGYRNMGIAQFPEVDFPVVNVTTYREGASPETMDFDVTDVIEDSVSGIEGIDYIQSQSSEGVSVVTVYFHLHRNVDVAMQDVQNAVSAAMNRLPTDVDPPIVSRVNFNKFPVMWLSVHGNKPLVEINDAVEKEIKHEIESVPGCGGMFYGGLRSRNMRIWLDGASLQAQGMDALDAMRALRAEHVERPAGRIESERREMNVRIMGEAQTPEHFNHILVRRHDGQLVKVGDIGVVEQGMADKRGFARYNRMPNVGLGILRASGANIVQLCDEVKAKLPELRKKAHKHGLEISVSTDFSLFIKDDIEEVQFALFLGIVLTAIVCFFFLGSIGTTANVCVTIPVSLIGTLMAMRFFGFTLNFMTLLALSLSVGVVVDDAILVLENIYRRREHGEGKLDAARRGAKEIAFAASAATFSIAAIFIPVAFMKGAIGRFFFEFGITVTVAVLLSLLVSLTVTPMLCAFFLNVHKTSRPLPARYRGLLGPIVTLGSWTYWLFDRWVLEMLLLKPFNFCLVQMTRLYTWMLGKALRHPWWVLSGGGLIAASVLLFVFGMDIPLPAAVTQLTGKEKVEVKPLGAELVPSEDQNRLVINLICPVGSSIDYTDEIMQRGEAILAAIKDPVTEQGVIASFFAAVSIRPGQNVSEGIMFVRLIPNTERSWTQTEVMNEIRKRFAGIAGVRVLVMDLSTQGFSARRGFPVNFAVQGPDWERVIDLSERIRQRMTDSGVVTDVNSDYQPGMPEVQLIPDKQKAAERGVSVQRLGFAINVAMGGFRAGRYTLGDRRYDVRMRYQEGQRASPDQLPDIYIKSDSGQLIPLRDLTTQRNVSTLPTIHRYNHLRKVELTANTLAGISQGEAIRRCAEIAEQVRQDMELPTSYRIIQLGNAQAMKETLDSMWWALALGFIIAWMILGVQFNSFVHPFTVLMAVPFGVTGAVACLWWFGDTLNLLSMIGLVLLAGLVKKNSIILVDYANQLRHPHEGKPGLPLQEAVLAACPVRLRPIIMTSLATIAGALPLAFGVGPGAETRAPLARGIIGGITLSTLVTLFFVPVLYVQLDRLGTWFMSLTRRVEPPSKPTTASVAPVASANGATTVKLPAKVVDRAGVAVS